LSQVLASASAILAIEIAGPGGDESAAATTFDPLTFPSSMTKRRQKFHGTKLAQCSTKADASSGIVYAQLSDLTDRVQEVIGCLASRSTASMAWHAGFRSGW
jgi:hypothetical protein